MIDGMGNSAGQTDCLFIITGSMELVSYKFSDFVSIWGELNKLDKRQSG